MKRKEPVNSLRNADKDLSAASMDVSEQHTKFVKLDPNDQVEATHKGMDQTEASVGYNASDERDLDFDTSFFEGEVHANVDLDAILKAVNEAPPVQEMDESKARSSISRLEKAISTNYIMRSKYPDDPEKFMASEVDIDEALTVLKELAVVPQLYDLFISLRGCETLTTLLSHENESIHVSVIALLSELVNADALAPDPSNQKGFRAAWNLVAELIRQRTFVSLMQAVERLDPTDEENTPAAIFNCLSLFEAVIEGKPTLGSLFVTTTCIISFLVSQIVPPHELSQMERESNITTVSSHRLYASEILLLLGVVAKHEVQKVLSRLKVPGYHTLPPLSTDSEESIRIRLGLQKAIIPWISSECLTQDFLNIDEESDDEENEETKDLSSSERKKNEKLCAPTAIAKSRYGSKLQLVPAVKALFDMVEPTRKVIDVHIPDLTQEELYLNVFNVIFAAIDSFAESKRVLLESHGLETLIMLAQRRNIFLAPSLRIIEAMLQGSDLVARRIIDMGGLKTVFGLLSHLESMFKAHKDLRVDKVIIEERLAGIILELLLQLSGDKRYERVLTKMCEKDFAKCSLFAQIFSSRRRAVADAEARFLEGLSTTLSEKERYAALSEGSRYIRKLERGWTVAQRSAALLALVLTAVAAQISATRPKGSGVVVKQEEQTKEVIVKTEFGSASSTDAGTSVLYALTPDAEKLIKIIHANDLKLQKDIADTLREYNKYVDTKQSHLKFYADVMIVLAEAVASSVFVEYEAKL